MNPLTLAQKVFLLLAGLSGATAVGLGAMSAHWLKDKLNYWDMNTFETAAAYQMYHTLALLGLVAIMKFFPSKLLVGSGVLLVIGIALFSGSLYLLAIKDLYRMPSLGALGPVTPIGGVAFIAAWILMGVAVLVNWKDALLNDR